MRVDQIMTKQVSRCSPDQTLAEAAQLMWDHDCGCLPVCTGNGASRIVGVITDRDICMSALFKGKPLHELRVSDAMSTQLQTCRPDDSVADVEKKMREAKIRRLPVVDEQGALVGMVSLADLAREAARENALPEQEITEMEVGDTLAAICQPAGQQLAA
ncbi:MAG TPA: CBS domain-containing protein [Steroidobacter sp.]|jgi:CBS domain-containing protein|nr:CBS domain-containing protein [Steroidobacteraceae bacterium]HLS79879.1 CBS domain-containing protein [Steroidobacter sp.]